jgi:hypothetical protein
MINFVRFGCICVGLCGLCLGQRTCVAIEESSPRNLGSNSPTSCFVLNFIHVGYFVLYFVHVSFVLEGNIILLQSFL